MPVLLFDIDGTLVRTAGAGKVAMQAALRSTFHLTDLPDRVPFSGRTDPAIMRDLLAENGVPVTDENVRQLAEAYLSNLEPALTQLGGEVCPGVRELLARLATEHHILGLLTGNMRRGAERKLAHFGLWDYFPAGGGFGDVHADRDDVARAAVAAIRAGEQPVWVIGDTPLDVQCARAIGAVAVAVTTGWHTHAELAACEPDYLLPDLTQAAEVLPWGL